MNTDSKPWDVNSDTPPAPVVPAAAGTIALSREECLLIENTALKADLARQQVVQHQQALQGLVVQYVQAKGGDLTASWQVDLVGQQLVQG